jgi:DNA polymerase (family 10)
VENEKIIQTLRLYVSLMELHEENSFKIRGTQNAIFTLEKTSENLQSLSLEELTNLDGLGKSAASKVHDLAQKGAFDDFIELAQKTPKGVVDMMNIKGIGPKKVRTIWKELEIINKEDLLKACIDGEISQLTGFGEKTQESIKQALLFTEEHKSKFLYMELDQLASDLETKLQDFLSDCKVKLSGEMRRYMEVVETIQFIVGSTNLTSTVAKLETINFLSQDEAETSLFIWRGNEPILGIKIEIKIVDEADFNKQFFLNTLNPEHLKKRNAQGIQLGQILLKRAFISEQDFYREAGMQFIEPEMREGMLETEKALNNSIPELITEKDLKGILHNHCTYSDGIHTLTQMAVYCKEMGYEYLGISDHSKTAFYANGLQENRVREQHLEIDKLNQELTPFKIFKGIESDILNDGSLDYSPDVLASFDFIVASVHSNLKMTKDKATQRLITAIENPYTTILGHATGRLLLRREGYPIDHQKIIDACHANNVIIEINANPRRLDMDWRWVVYALEKGILISINPDAHSMPEYHNMKYGVLIGRKAGLSKNFTFNAFSKEEVEKHFNLKKTAAL